MGVFVPFLPLTCCETMSLPEPRSLHPPRGWWGPTPLLCSRASSQPMLGTDTGVKESDTEPPPRHPQ